MYITLFDQAHSVTYGVSKTTALDQRDGTYSIFEMLICKMPLAKDVSLSDAKMILGRRVDTEVKRFKSASSSLNYRHTKCTCLSLISISSADPQGYSAANRTSLAHERGIESYSFIR